MKIEQLVVGPLGVNCYIVLCEDTKQAAVIDPGENAEKILRELKGVNVVAIVNTHGHADHIGANARIKEKTQAPIFIHEADAPMLSDARLNLSAFMGEEILSPVADRILKSGDTIVIGGLRFCVLHTPGHTPGGICLLERDQSVLFSGDTLFAESVGRTDFPGGSMAQLVEAVQNKLMILPDDTKVLPGHGPATTIGHERSHNPFLSQ